MGLSIRPLASPSDFEAAEDVQAKAWGMAGGRGVTPKEVLIAMHDNGGLVLGAFDGKMMVGLAVMMPGNAGGRAYLYSHQTGVVPEYRSRGVGYLLKQKQREAALESGVGMIAWTFDPIIALNAYFNMGKLGAIARNYHVDYYGRMPDSINDGWPTDRFLAEWYVDPRTRSRISRSARVRPDACSVLKTGGGEPNPRCLDWEVDLKAPQALVRIPGDIVALKRTDPSEALRWRRATREVFSSYFNAGYSAVSVDRRGGALHYVLGRVRLSRNIFDRPGGPS